MRAIVAEFVVCSLVAIGLAAASRLTIEEWFLDLKDKPLFQTLIQRQRQSAPATEKLNNLPSQRGSWCEGAPSFANFYWPPVVILTAKMSRKLVLRQSLLRVKKAMSVSGDWL